MLEFDHVCFQYEVDDYAIMDKLSFQIQDGEFVSVIGPSGCGKSTIFRLVNKLLTPDAGQVLVNGQPITTQKNYCGYMPQHDLLFPWRTVKENVMLPMEIQGGYSKAEMEQRAEKAEISGRLIPLPSEISAGCGLAWKTELSEKDTIMNFMEQQKLHWEAMYELLMF